MDRLDRLPHLAELGFLGHVVIFLASIEILELRICSPLVVTVSIILRALKIKGSVTAPPAQDFSIGTMTRIPTTQNNNHYIIIAVEYYSVIHLMMCQRGLIELCLGGRGGAQLTISMVITFVNGMYSPVNSVFFFCRAFSAKLAIRSRKQTRARLVKSKSRIGFSLASVTT